MGAVVPFDLERCQSFFGSSHVVRDDRDGIVQPYDLAYAPDGSCRGIIEVLHAPAEDGRLRECGNLHAGWASVDAVARGSIDFRSCIEALRRRADQLEIRRRFERDVYRHRHLRCLRGQLAIIEAPSGRFVDHLAVLRTTRLALDAPAVGCGRNQHAPGGRTGLAQRLPRTPYGIGIAGCLHADQRIGVELFVGRRMLEMHLLQANIELFCDQHRDRRIGALAHLDIRHSRTT